MPTTSIKRTLERSLIYAQTPTVIASLSLVDDQRTSILMKPFYTHLKQGKGKAAAPRAAHADMRAKYPHLYYWSAFILTGCDPGPVISSKRSATD